MRVGATLAASAGYRPPVAFSGVPTGGAARCGMQGVGTACALPLYDCPTPDPEGPKKEKLGGPNYRPAVNVPLSIRRA